MTNIRTQQIYIRFGRTLEAVLAHVKRWEERCRRESPPLTVLFDLVDECMRDDPEDRPTAEEALKVLIADENRN